MRYYETQHAFGGSVAGEIQSALCKRHMTLAADADAHCEDLLEGATWFGSKPPKPHKLAAAAAAKGEADLHRVAAVAALLRWVQS